MSTTLISQSKHPLLVDNSALRTAGPNTIAHRWSEFLALRHVNSTVNTHVALKTTYKAITEYFDPHTKLEDLTPAACANWLMHLLGTKRIKTVTANYYRQWLSIFFNWCVDLSYMTVNPFTQIRRVKPQRAVRNPMTREDVEALVRVAHKSKHSFWAYAVLLAWHTSLRLSDVSFLEKKSINWTDETIAITPIKTKKVGIEVVVPIEPTELYPVLREMYDQSNPALYGPLSRFVCPEMALRYQADGGRTLNGSFETLRKWAGVDEGKSFHCLRHGFCSRMMNAGADCIVVSSITGHTNLNTLRGYVKVSDQAKRNALLQGNSR